jgi:WD40 repeat protein
MDRKEEMSFQEFVSQSPLVVISMILIPLFMLLFMYFSSSQNKAATDEKKKRELEKQELKRKKDQEKEEKKEKKRELKEHEKAKRDKEDEKMKKLVVLLKGHTGRVNGSQYSLDGKWIASISEDRTLRVFPATAEQKTPIPVRINLPLDSATSVCFSADSHHIILSTLNSHQIIAYRFSSKVGSPLTYQCNDRPKCRKMKMVNSTKRFTTSAPD